VRWLSVRAGWLGVGGVEVMLALIHVLGFEDGSFLMFV
jgi:hypothetical protein